MAKISPLLEPPTETSRYSVPNLDRALTILEVLSTTPAGLSLSELAAAIAIPTNSVFRITRTLEERGYLERDEATKRFRLTQKLLRLSCGPAMGERSLSECSHDAMRELREELKETVLLGTLIGAEGVVLDQVPGKHAFRFSVDVGIRFELHTAAPGKAILAALPGSEVDAIMERMPFTRFNSRTITTKPAFLAELRRTLESGYGVDEGEENEGAHCVGAAILNSQRRPVGAVWITGPSSRMPAKEFARLGNRIREAARQISEKLGHFSQSFLP
jgi:DNA-binding IclR family transcriptional regulator